MIDQQVVLGHRQQTGYETVKNQRQVVDQVFCAGAITNISVSENSHLSAVNMAQGSTGMKNRESDKYQDKMSFILQAAYTGTYLAAICNKRYHCRPTPILMSTGRNYS